MNDGWGCMWGTSSHVPLGGQHFGFHLSNNYPNAQFFQASKVTRKPHNMLSRCHVETVTQKAATQQPKVRFHLDPSH